MNPLSSKQPRCLYFIATSTPTPEEIEDAREVAALGVSVVFRNAAAHDPSGCLESCNCVAGEVPKKYSDNFPDPETCLAHWDAEANAYTPPEGVEATQPPAGGEKTQGAPVPPAPAAPPKPRGAAAKGWTGNA